ncbi:MAG: TolC family protein [Symploca sp. SIO2E9]|nr:TolC family protein [Symploca sp. SIO2E9]
MPKLPEQNSQQRVSEKKGGGTSKQTPRCPDAQTRRIKIPTKISLTPQQPNHYEEFSNRPINFLTLNIAGTLAATLGTAFLFFIAVDSKPIEQPVALTETASVNSIFQSANFGNFEFPKQQINQQLPQQETAIFTSENNQEIIQELGVPPQKLWISTLGVEAYSVQLDEINDLDDLTVDLLPLKDLVESKSHQHLESQSLSQQLPALEFDFGALLPTNLTLNYKEPKQEQPVAEIRLQTSIEAIELSKKITETSLKQTNAESTQKNSGIELNLPDVIVLALENNRDIKNAYLERIVQRQELAVAEDEFVPNFTPEVSVSLERSGLDRNTTGTNDFSLGANLSLRIPTGGELTFQWTGNAQTLSGNGLSINTNDDTFNQNLELSFNQPLLRGAGIKVNRANLEIARLTEQVNILDLKSTLIDTITDAIVAYRRLLQAQERLKIEELALEGAQELLEITQVLIDAGRRAPVDIVQSETAVANRKVSLLTAQNDFEAARLELINILDIERNIAILAAEQPTAEAVDLDYNNLQELAFKNQPAYLQAQLELERAKLDLLQAENNRLWDLSLDTSVSNASNATTDLRAGVVLSRELGDLTLERDFQRSRVNQLQATNNLEEQRESLEIELTDRIRDVSLSFSQVELARRATELSERQLEIEQERQRLGRGSTIFEIVNLQNDLAQARNAELDAIINYLNALTRLDQTLGTTLDTWQVKIEREEQG